MNCLNLYNQKTYKKRSMLFDPDNLQILQLPSCRQAVRCHSDVEEEYLNISKSIYKFWVIIFIRKSQINRIDSVTIKNSCLAINWFLRGNQSVHLWRKFYFHLPPLQIYHYIYISPTSTPDISLYIYISTYHIPPLQRKKRYTFA